MAARDPDLIQAIELGVWTDDDGTVQATLTACLTDDNITTGCNSGNVSKVGKGGSPHGDCTRLEFNDGKADLANGDTIDADITTNHQIATMALLAYTDANTVTTTNKVTTTWGTGNRVLTMTAAFIGELGDLGSGKFAVRIVEDGGLSGDCQYAEIGADLTAGGGNGDNRRRQVLRRRRR